MAKDRVVYSNRAGSEIRASQYAQLKDNWRGDPEINIRGSVYSETWPVNTFDAAAARNVATYILELADDIEAGVRELKAELEHELGRLPLRNTEEVARALIAKGYHK